MSDLFFFVLEWMGQLVEAFGFELLFLGALGLLGLLIAGVLAPLGALNWWSDWSGDQQATAPAPQAPPELPRTAPAAHAGVAPPAHYLVYLSGIGDVSGDYLAEKELQFVRRLAAELPETRVIHDIFAFSVTNIGLIEEEGLGRFWAWVLSQKTQGRRLKALGGLINLRNLLQVAVSADRRYGPVYNFGMARTILHSLQEQGYVLGSGTPVTLYGYSGGGQVVLGCSEFLKPALAAPLQVISMGGVMADCGGLEAADRITHLGSNNDSVQALGGRIFPRRWPIARGSRWNRALASGRLRVIDMSPMVHSGLRSYIDGESLLPDGRSYLDKTVGLVSELVREHTASPPAAAHRLAGPRADSDLLSSPDPL